MLRLIVTLTCLIVVSLALTVALAGNSGDASWSRFTILPPAPPPVMDGTLSPGEWDGATAVTGFTVLGQSQIIANQPVVRVAWTPEALLVAAQIPLPPGEKAHARATDFDGTVWEDDSIEVHLDRGHQHKQNHQFVVNALGTRFDSRGGDKDFSAAWEAKALNEPGRWSAEVAIPWAAVGGAPNVGDMDGLNVIVNSSWLGGTLTFAPISGSAHDTAGYAHVVYGQDAAVSVERLDGGSLNEIALRGLGKAETTVQYTLSAGGNPVDAGTVTLAPGAAGSVPIRVPVEQGLPRAGDYAVALSATGPNGLLLARQVSIKVDVPLRLTFSADEKAGTLTARLAGEPSVFPPQNSEYDLMVTGPNGTIKQAEHQAIPAAGALAILTLRRDQLQPGTLTFRVNALNRETGRRYDVERVLDSPLHPEWLGTREGLTDKVPAPWTPVSVKGMTVNCWGRGYGFGPAGLPSQVTTRNASVLAGPVALTGTAAGKALAWAGKCSVTERKPTHAVISGQAAASGLKLSGTTRVEFDGMIRCDLTLTPPGGQMTIRDLTLEIPIKPEYARYLYHFPGAWGTVANSGYLPKDGWRSPFKPYVWLGDEDRGFSWFCESDQNWFPLDNKTALTIERTATATVLKCHLIATETRITGPLTYTFGFQATPVKQPEKTVWDYRLLHEGNYGLENERGRVGGGKIVYPAAKHVRREEGTFECWYRPAVDSERGKPYEQRTYQGNRDLFTVQLAPGMGGSNYGLYWNGMVQGLVAWARTDGVVTDNPGYSFDWKAGEWHHVALTWDKEHLRIYLDGKLVSDSPNNGFLAAPLEQAELILGGDMALATIDEARILLVARPPVLTEKPYEADAETLLLDHFDNYGEKGTALGVADASLKFVPGKFGLAPTWEPGLAQSRLEQLAEMGVRTVCFHEHWVPYQSYPHVTDADRPRLHSLVDGMHANKLDLLLYMSRQFADNAPEWELHNEEFLTEPRPGPYTRAPAQRAYLACWNSPFKDFALHYLGQTMDEFGHDGWYLDGPEWPMACANKLHGCGYDAPDGTRRAAYDIFATRDFMRRLYVLTRQRKPEGQLNIHNSTVMVTPTLSWGTSTWGGEQIDAIKPPIKTLDALPMDAFRTEFMGRQWGLPSEFLVYEGMPYYSKDVLAYTLLHGVLIRPLSLEQQATTAALWKVHDEFPFSHGEMLGYWCNGGLVKIEGSPSGSLTPELGREDVYATVWTLPKQGSLIVVSNLSDQDRDARVTLQLAKLGAMRTPRVWDALSGETLEAAGGKVALPVKAWRYRVLRVK